MRLKAQLKMPDLFQSFESLRGRTPQWFRTLIPPRIRRLGYPFVSVLDRLTFRPHVRTLDVEGDRLLFYIGDRVGEFWYANAGNARGPQFRFIRDHLLSADDVVFDCGARHGWLSVLLAKHLRGSGLLVAVEAHPRNAKIISKNVELNKIRNMRVYNLAIGRECGFTCMEDATHVCLFTVAKRKKRGMTVPMTTLDMLAREVGRLPTLLKLDIEGMEFDALKGAAQLLKARPKLTIEIHCKYI